MNRIVVKDLCKVFRLYRRPIDRLLEAVSRRPRHRAFTALADVSFDVPPGGTLGIIGDNGAGKSTLLKILVGTLSPTSGQVRVSGRIAALLELGAGFHPEFSGRQNIYLNAALMNIERDEIVRKEDAIIEFSGLGDFIDRPVKLYSSGMYIRLAFAIATSVDPDILVVDEALAVGDMAFQQKCVERMHEFREQGKMMIFCSHSMYLVRELCATVLWLDHGRPHRLGPAQQVTEAYEDLSARQTAGSREIMKGDSTPTPSTPKTSRIVYLGIESPDGTRLDAIEPLSTIIFKMKVEILQDGLCPQFGFALTKDQDNVYSMILTHHDQVACGPYPLGTIVTVRLQIDSFTYRTGRYKLLGGVSDRRGILWQEMEQLYPVPVAENTGHGLVVFQRNWSIDVIEAERQPGP